MVCSGLHLGPKLTDIVQVPTSLGYLMMYVGIVIFVANGNWLLSAHYLSGLLDHLADCWAFIYWMAKGHTILAILIMRIIQLWYWLNYPTSWFGITQQWLTIWFESIIIASPAWPLQMRDIDSWSERWLKGGNLKYGIKSSNLCVLFDYLILRLIPYELACLLHFW